MQISINHKYKTPILLTILTTFFFLFINTEKALSGGGDGTENITTENTAEPAGQSTGENTDSSSNSSAGQSNGSVTFTPTTLLQTGNNNYANVNSNLGALNYPNCGGTCAFAIMRTTPVNNTNGTTSNQIEGVVGVIHSFSSADQTNAQSNRQLVNIQQQKSESEITSNYIKTIADACQAKDFIRAELTAKALGRIWKLDYKTLLHSSCS